jgi:neutral ceramidase
MPFMGFAEATQIGTGLRQRLYSRAFIIGDPQNPKDRIVYLVLDLQSGDTSVRDGILKVLKPMGPEYAIYTKDNIAVSGTHSHSGPGGWTNYFLHQIGSNGFDKQGWEAVVKGAVLSIRRAHESLKQGKLSFGKIRIEDASINRSLYSYSANPEAERANFKDTVDKDLSLIRFSDLSGEELGMLTFFATHGTSMHSNNTLVTGDNKGVAAYLVEKRFPKGYVAGFSQSNVGDVSPNVLGAYCEGGIDDGKKCRFEDDTCGGRVEQCHARGPFYGSNDGGAKSCFEIGKRQADKAYDLLQEMRAGKETPIKGPVRSYHTFENFASYRFPLPNGTQVETCPPAFGYSFAAGTSDGPGIADFYQGIRSSSNVSMLWPFLSGLIKTPTAPQKRCQAPKPILLDLGELHWPYEWVPSIVDIQMFRVGQLYVLVSTGEATTMSGRRWKEAVRMVAKSSQYKNDTTEPLVVLGGPANSYSHYVATKEEYTMQRYEAASTLYGQYTLDAYIHATTSKMRFLGEERVASIEAGPPPPINNDVAWIFLIPSIPTDRPPARRKFGDIIKSPKASYKRGEIANVTFVGAHPRNNFRQESTFAAVQKYVGKPELLPPPTQSEKQPPGPEPRGPTDTTDVNQDFVLDDQEVLELTEETIEQFILAPPITDEKEWETVRDDQDWDLIFESLKGGFLRGRTATLKWDIGKEVEPGKYRFLYNGDWRSASGKLTAFRGVSEPFDVS